MRRIILGLAMTAIAALGPALASASDQETAQQIAAALRKSGQLTDYSIGVKFEDGTAWIMGRVANEEQMQRALTLAGGLPYVANVVNELEIKPSKAATGTAPSVRFSTPVAKQPSVKTPTATQPTVKQLAPPSKVVHPEATLESRDSGASKGVQRAENSDAFAGMRALFVSRKNAPAASKTVQTAASELAPVQPSVPESDMPSPPGDPLTYSNSAQFAAPPSRRFATDPVFKSRPTNARPKTATAAKAKSSAGVTQASQEVEASDQFEQAPMPRAMPRQVAQTRSTQGAPKQGRKVTQVAANMPNGLQPVEQMMSPGGQTYEAGYAGACAYPNQCGPGQCGPGGCPPAGLCRRGIPGGPRGIPGAGPQMGGPVAGNAYDQPAMPGYAWPSYAAYPNYAAVTYPKQYSPTAWPYIGPFYPYPQVPLGWRKVTLQWDDGWWFLDFYDHHNQH
jgi:hypothetical protein